MLGRAMGPDNQCRRPDATNHIQDRQASLSTVVSAAEPAPLWLTRFGFTISARLTKLGPPCAHRGIEAAACIPNRRMPLALLPGDPAHTPGANARGRGTAPWYHQ